MISLPQLANPTYQLSQCRRCKQHRHSVVRLTLLRRTGHRQICPGPRQ